MFFVSYFTLSFLLAFLSCDSKIDWEVQAKDTPNIEASNYINSIINNGSGNNGILKEIQPALDDLRISNPKPIAAIQPRPAPVTNSYNFANTTLPRKRSNGGVKPDFSKQGQAGKRFSLLDPDFFVPAVGSGLSNAAYSTRAPSPWKPQTIIEDNRNCNGLSRHSSMKQPTCSPVPAQYRSHSRNQLMSTQHSENRNVAPKPFAASPAPRTASRNLINNNRQSYHENHSHNNGNGNGNNHYYNYFYQTLKQTNPYQDLPESVLLWMLNPFLIFPTLLLYFFRFCRYVLSFK